MIDSARNDMAAPGAIHADVPSRPVSVAPPTIVDLTTSSSFSALMSVLAGTPLYVAKRDSGIMVVSPWPPITIPSTSPALHWRA